MSNQNKDFQKKRSFNKHRGKPSTLDNVIACGQSSQSVNMYQLPNQPKGWSKKKRESAKHVWTKRTSTDRIILIWQETLDDHFQK